MRFMAESLFSVWSFHWLGGLASGSFYVPYRSCEHWSWETYWLVERRVQLDHRALGARLALLTKDLLGVLGKAPASCLFWSYFWGAMWGLGRPDLRPDDALPGHGLGNGRGPGLLRGLWNADAADLPRGSSRELLLGTQSGLCRWPAWAFCLLGIAVAGLAGMSQGKRNVRRSRRRPIKEFNFKKGILVATPFSGVMSASFSYGLDAGEPIKRSRPRHGTPDLWQGLPVLVVILLGGFTANFIWCVLLNIRTRRPTSTSAARPHHSPGRDEETIIETAIDAPSEEVVEHIPRQVRAARASPCCRTTSSAPGRHDLVHAVLLLYHGRSRRWENTSFPVGPCTWPASSFSARSGESPCANGKAPAGARSRLVTVGLAVLVGSTIACRLRQLPREPCRGPLTEKLTVAQSDHGIPRVATVGPSPTLPEPEPHFT